MKRVQAMTGATCLPLGFFSATRTAAAKPLLIASVIAGALTAGCGGGGGGDDDQPRPASCSVSQIEADMNAMLQERVDLAAANPGVATYVPFDKPFSFAVERPDGRQYSFNWNSTLNTSYESASTSKLVSAVIIMRLVEKKVLNLADKPQERIGAEGWPIGDSSLTGITLDHLLSFTSGLEKEPQVADFKIGCLDAPGFSFAQCVQNIAVENSANVVSPGQRFYYTGTHLQVAGLMAIKARGATDWQAVFSEFQQETGVFPTAAYDLPSSGNPRLAGGMHWTAEEYMTFLRKLSNGSLLQPESMSQMLADHTATIPMVSPLVVLGEDWHYGYGLWLECENEVFDCNPETARVSSPGAWGSYPFWDRSKGYFGIVARQDKEQGSFPEGIAIERFIRLKVEEWVACP